MPLADDRPIEDVILANLAAAKAWVPGTPKPNAYAGEPEAIARREREIAATRQAYGVVPEPAKTPEQIKEENFAASWSGGNELHPETAERYDNELERVEAFGRYERDRALDDLKEHFGADKYAAMVADAKTAVNAGEWSDAIGLSKPLLTYFAARGRYNAAYAVARTAAGLK
jgi:hypothetical protein